MPDRLVGEIEAARQYRKRARAANTTRAYASDWAQFEGWCWERNLEPLPASTEVVATYLAARARAGNAPSTITRHLAAIDWQHRQAGVVAPQARDTKMVIADTLAGIRREQRARPTGKKGGDQRRRSGADDRQGLPKRRCFFNDSRCPGGWRRIRRNVEIHRLGSLVSWSAAPRPVVIVPRPSPASMRPYRSHSDSAHRPFPPRGRRR